MQDRTTGFGSVPILRCDGNDQPYRAEVVSNSNRQFKWGAANAGASGYVEGMLGGQSFLQTTFFDDQRIVIRRR